MESSKKVLSKESNETSITLNELAKKVNNFEKYNKFYKYPSTVSANYYRGKRCRNKSNQSFGAPRDTLQTSVGQGTIPDLQHDQLQFEDSESSGKMSECSELTSVIDLNKLPIKSCNGGETHGPEGDIPSDNSSKAHCLPNQSKEYVEMGHGENEYRDLNEFTDQKECEIPTSQVSVENQELSSDISMNLEEQNLAENSENSEIICSKYEDVGNNIDTCSDNNSYVDGEQVHPEFTPDLEVVTSACKGEDTPNCMQDVSSKAEPNLVEKHDVCNTFIYIGENSSVAIESISKTSMPKSDKIGNLTTIDIKQQKNSGEFGIFEFKGKEDYALYIYKDTDCSELCKELEKYEPISQSQLEKISNAMSSYKHAYTNL